MPTYRVLDLFCGLGGFSAAFEDSDRWAVTTVDIEDRFDPDVQADVMDLRPSDFEQDFDVVLAGHPCTLFSTAGNHDEWDMQSQTPVGERAQDHLAMLYHTLGLIQALAPTYWYLENPRRSRIQWYLGKPDEWVSYCQYGKDYQKDTGLWGDHAPGMTYRKCSDDGCHKSNTDSDGYCAVASMDTSDHAARSMIPRPLSEAIRDACERALAGEVPEQAPLAEF